MVDQLRLLISSKETGKTGTEIDNEIVDILDHLRSNRLLTSGEYEILHKDLVQMSTTLLLNSSQTTRNSTNFSVYYNPPIILDPGKQYEIGLISTAIRHSMANAKTNVNDDFTFISGAWVSVKISVGAHNVTDLNKTVKELIGTAVTILS